MPTYQYRCTDCGTDLEAVQKFTDPTLTECPTCHGSLRKVFNAVGVVFKGSGFYRTDSRPKEGASSGSSGSANGESKSEPKTKEPTNGGGEEFLRQRFRLVGLGGLEREEGSRQGRLELVHRVVVQQLTPVDDRHIRAPRRYH